VSAILRFDGVTKRFGGREVLRGVDLELEKGGFVVVYGAVGVGKSTLINLAHFQEFPDEGRVEVLGVSDSEVRRSKSKLQNVRRKVGVITQIPVHLEDATCYENVSLVLERLGFNKNVVRERTERALERVGLWERRNASPKELSAGQRQKLAIARAIAKEPVILLADDPTLGLDDNASDEIEQLFLDINDFGTTILWTSNRIPKIAKGESNITLYHLEDGKLKKVLNT